MVIAETARQIYEVCSIAFAALPVTHPVGLSLALNFSVLQYEVLGHHKQACDLARTVFSKSIEELFFKKKALPVSYMQSKKIMLFLRKNVAFWTSDKSIAGNVCETRERKSFQ